MVVLQSHLDMVQEKNRDVDFDFASDAIRPQRDGEYLKATGTTLGSDNGMGVAAMLAVMDADDVVHGPLELLFTMDEETGLTGASSSPPTCSTASACSTSTPRRRAPSTSAAPAAATACCACRSPRRRRAPAARWSSGSPA